MGKKLRIFKKVNGVRHILVGDQYVPDIIEPIKGHFFGKFFYARARFLLNHRRDIFFHLKMEGRLQEHMESIEDEAFEMVRYIMAQMLKAEPIPESLKNTDQLKWVGLMNNYQHSAEEIVMNELIYPEGPWDEMEEELMELPESTYLDVRDVFIHCPREA
jgi:hypothetical protein